MSELTPEDKILWTEKEQVAQLRQASAEHLSRLDAESRRYQRELTRIHDLRKLRLGEK